jgi:molecular chaperone GrpE (heat shock protein)
MIARLVESVAAIVSGRLQVWRLRRELFRTKSLRYDQLAARYAGLLRAQERQKRVARDLYDQLQRRDEKIKRLRDEYTALQARQIESREDIVRDERLAMFRRLQVLVTQIPSLRAAQDQGAQLSGSEVLSMLYPLEEMLRDVGFEAIGGEVGAEVPYDPLCHKPVGRGARSVTPEDIVRVRYVGYAYDGAVVSKAEVTLVSHKEPTSSH